MYAKTADVKVSCFLMHFLWLQTKVALVLIWKSIFIEVLDYVKNNPI